MSLAVAGGLEALRGGELTKMESTSFQVTLGNFPADMVSGPVSALAILLHNCSSKCPLSVLKHRAAPQVTQGLWFMKREGRRPEEKWRKTWNKSNMAWARAHFKAYYTTVMVTKKTFLPLCISTVQTYRTLLSGQG